MKRDGLLGVIVVSIFIVSSLWVQAAEKPARTKPAPGTMTQDRAAAISKSCEQWQKRREDACKKAAPKKKQERDANQKKDPQFYQKQKCEGVTQGKEKKQCDKEGHFVLQDSNYGTQYQFSCSYEGKLLHWDNLSPAFRVDMATGTTDKLIGKGYCVANHRIENIMEDRDKCTVFPYNISGTFPEIKLTQKKRGDKDTCREGIVQMAGDFDDAVIRKLNKDIPCFQATKGQGKKAEKGEVGVISGFHGDGDDGKKDRRIITFCRDHQDKVIQEIKKAAESGALAYDADAKKFKLSEAGDDKAKQDAAKESLKKSSLAPDASAVDMGDAKPKPQTGVTAGDRGEKARVTALEKEATDAHAAAPEGSDARRILDERKAESDKAEAALAAFNADAKRKGDTAEYTRLVEAEARANARYNRAISLEHYNQWLRYYQSQPETTYTRIYIRAYQAALPK